MPYPIPVRHAVVASLFSAAILGISPILASDYFTGLDTNADGVLSGREVTDLKALDSDGDGELTLEEFKNALAEHAQKLDASDRAAFAERDGNHDERLSGTEISGYEFTDLDGDGRIPEAEFIEGRRQQRRALAGRTTAELRAVTKERFTLLDITEDGRLSGTEMTGLAHYDFNRDKRVSQDEFTLGMILDSAAIDSTDPPDNTGPAELLNVIVKSVNDGASTQIFRRMRSELMPLVDAPILDYAITILQKHHGVLQDPATTTIHQSKPGENGEVEIVAPIPCETGELKLHITVIENKLLGFRFESPAIETLQADLYSELLTSSALTDKFAKYYSPICQTLIRDIIESKDDSAAGMFHPDVISQLGRDKFDNVFEGIRESVGERQSIEIESIGVEEDANGIQKLTISHRVKGSAGFLEISNKFQFTGMKAAMVAISAEPVDPAMDNVENPDKNSPMPFFTATEDGLKFRIPGNPTRTFDKASNIVTWQLDNKVGGAKYTVQIFTFDADMEGDSKEFFTKLNESLVSNLDGKIVNEGDGSWNGHPGQMVMIEAEGKGVVIRRDIIIGTKVYALQFQVKKLSEDLEEHYGAPFTESFELTSGAKDDAVPAPPAASPAPPAASPAPPAASPDDDIPAPPRP